MSQEVDAIRLKFELLRPVMDERMTRLWAATEARALGFGGGQIVTAATGIRSKRIWLGKLDLEQIAAKPPKEKPRDQRIRRPGLGAKARRRHAIKVAGWTTASTSVHRDQTRESSTQKARCVGWRRGRRTWRRSTANC